MSQADYNVSSTPGKAAKDAASGVTWVLYIFGALYLYQMIKGR